MTLARTAASYGALCANRARVIGLLREGERVTGARVVDLENGRELAVRARQVLNATGVWTDETQALANSHGQLHVRASKGVDLLVPRDRIASSAGLLLSTATSVLFVIPWGRHWLVGTTDTDWDLDTSHPAVSAADTAYLLEQVNRVLASPLAPADVVGVYAGLRPLLAGESDPTSKLSREHLVGHPVPGLVVVAGGKFTTYRVMAKDAVDAAVRAMDVVATGCVRVPLVGADGWSVLWNRRHVLSPRRCPARTTPCGPRWSTPRRTRAPCISTTAWPPDPHFDRVLGPGGGPRTGRRETHRRGARLEHQQRVREIEHHEKRVSAKRDAQRQPNDETADAARLGGPDIVPLG